MSACMVDRGRTAGAAAPELRDEVMFAKSRATREVDSVFSPVRRSSSKFGILNVL